MSIDDDLRTTMRAHDHEAPTELDWTPPNNRRRLVLPLVAAAVVLLVAGVLAVVGGNHDEPRRAAATTPPASAPHCPAKYESSDAFGGWVPARSRVDGATRRLVPDRNPDAAVVCDFGSRTKQRRLADLETIASALTLSPLARTQSTPCPLYFSPHDSERYLLGLRYAGRTLWVSAPRNHCDGSGNGTFTSRVNLGASAASALRTGRWPHETVNDTLSGRRATDTRCNPAGAGRLGDDRTLAPPGVLTVDVCRPAQPAGEADTFVRTLSRTRTDRVLSRLRKANAGSLSSVCRPAAAGVAPARLVLRYRTGPSVVISIDTQCGASVSNGALEARPTVAELRDLLT